MGDIHLWCAEFLDLPCPLPSIRLPCWGRAPMECQSWTKRIVLWQPILLQPCRDSVLILFVTKLCLVRSWRVGVIAKFVCSFLGQTCSGVVGCCSGFDCWSFRVSLCVEFVLPRSQPTCRSYYQKRKVSPKRKFLAGRPCGHPGQTLVRHSNLEKKNKHLGTRADVHEKHSAWKTSGWFYLYYFLLISVPLEHLCFVAHVALASWTSDRFCLVCWSSLLGCFGKIADVG